MGNVLGFAHTFYPNLIEELCADNTKISGLGRIVLLVLTPLSPLSSAAFGSTQFSYESTAAQTRNSRDLRM